MATPDLGRFLFAANLDKPLRCVDERQALDTTNGLEIPGGIYGVIDALKAITPGLTEAQAWQLVQASGIPIGAHVDDHHGALGCGYARLVETSPELVGAPEAVPAAQRLAMVQESGGFVYHYTGEHRPTHAVVNHVAGMSLDPDHASAEGLGVFGFDEWATPRLAEQLGVPPGPFTGHLRAAFEQTVTALTGINVFEELGK